MQIAGEHERAALMWAERGCRYEAALTLADSPTAITARRLRAQGARGIPRGPHARTRANPAGLSARELDVPQAARGRRRCAGPEVWSRRRSLWPSQRMNESRIAPPSSAVRERWT